jgi:hypothetical protein
MNQMLISDEPLPKITLGQKDAINLLIGVSI